MFRMRVCRLPRIGEGVTYRVTCGESARVQTLYLQDKVAVAYYLTRLMRLVTRDELYRRYGKEWIYFEAIDRQFLLRAKAAIKRMGVWRFEDQISKFVTPPHEVIK